MCTSKNPTTNITSMCHGGHHTHLTSMGRHVTTHTTIAPNNIERGSRHKHLLSHWYVFYFLFFIFIPFFIYYTNV